MVKERELRDEIDLPMHFVIKANVPVEDGFLFKEWDESCSAKAPVGFGDYRWGKILHDHLFVAKFKQRLEAIDKQLEEIKELLTVKKQNEDDNAGLMK
mgnify:CR=1 FL=1